MKSVLTVLFALALASLSVAQDTTKPVDYVSRALPLHQVLLDLEKKSGVRLDCDPAMENEPLILKLNHVTLQEALDKIALVFAADWVKRDNVLRLERSPTKLQALKADIFQKHLALVKKSIEALVIQCNSKPPLDEPSAEKLIAEAMRNTESNKQNRVAAARLEFQKLGARLPTMRMAVQLLAKMDPAEITALASGHRVVFCNRPNSMQRQLPEIEPEALQEWIAGRKAMAQAVAKIAPKPSEDNYAGQTFLEDRGDDGRIPVRVLVSSEDMGVYFPIILNFVFLDERGRALATDGEALGVSAASTLAFRQNSEEARRSALATGFELGPVGKELAPRMNAPSENLRSLPQFVIDALLHPTTQDPLSFAAADIILKSADIQGVDAVAVLDDTAPSYSLISARSGKASLDAFRLIMERLDAHTFQNEPGWIVAMPTDPVAVQEDRVPRPLLEDLMNDVLEQGLLTIEQAADAALGMSPRAFEMAESMLNPMFTVKGANAVFSDYDALRLYGMLSSAQKEKSKSKEGLTLAAPELTAEQKEALERFAFQGQKWVEGSPQQPTLPGDAYVEVERTDMLPDGISPDCRLVITIKEEQCVFGRYVYPGGIGAGWEPQNKDSLVYTLAPALNPEIPNNPATPKTDKFVLGTNRTLEVRLKRGELSIPASATERHFLTANAMTAREYLDSLPDAQRLELTKKIEEYLHRVQEWKSKSPSQPSSSPQDAPPSVARQ